MDNETIVLYTEDKELMKKVRQALVAKGFIDDVEWNRYNEQYEYLCIFFEENNKMCLFGSWIAGYQKPHHLSRTDLLTMFLLG